MQCDIGNLNKLFCLYETNGEIKKKKKKHITHSDRERKSEREREKLMN